MKLQLQFFQIFLSAFLLVFSTVGSCQQAWISYPVNQQIFTAPASFEINAEISGINNAEPAYIQVNHNLTGYRKLKIGNNPTSLYSPVLNLLAGNNDKVEITLRDFSGNCNWSKIRFRPQGTGTLSLEPYVTAVGGIGNGWKKIIIPLADFGTSVNLSQVSFIEFPYSADAGSFNIGFSEIRFTGGTTPLLWFGQENPNVIHDGTKVTSGGLPAVLVPASSSGVYAQKMEFYLDNVKTGEDVSAPYSVILNNLQTGNYSVFCKLILSDGSMINSPVTSFLVEPTPPQSLFITIDSPMDSTIVEPNTQVLVETSVVGAIPVQPSYLLVSNQLTGYRKLKFGYSPVSLYSPTNNVIWGGNNKIEITMKSTGNSVNWSKIQIRPTSTGALSIINYLPTGVSLNDWFTVTIPLIAFSSSIDFTKLAYIEFPYSADAGNFELAISSVRFLGGTTPFTWFGEGKTNNSHDGFGGTGQLVASLVTGNSSSETINRVEMLVDGVKTAEDFIAPYQFGWSSSEPGEYHIMTKVISNSSLTATSDSILVMVNSGTPSPSDLGISLTQPTNNQILLPPAAIEVAAEISGLDENTVPYLKVLNTQTGYRKLKLGYSPESIYGPVQNVISGGNNVLEISLISFGGPVNWNKIRIRPAGIGSLTLQNYVTLVGGIDNTWKTISIPLSDFDPTIDFTKISFIEFPYSADAGNFDLGISMIRFIGGSTPFTWFGEGKYDNSHDGFGNAGQLLATLVMPQTNPVTVSKVEFFNNNSLVFEDFEAPYRFQIQNLTGGEYHFYAKLTDSEGRYSTSDSVFITVLNDYPDGALVVNITFDAPPSNVTVSKAALKYNKDFAYSFSLDDSYRDAYTHAYTLLHGGFLAENNTNYPGLYYSDGCGNLKNFAGSLMWNSVNSNFLDIHINTPGYMTWNHLIEVVNSGWNVINHSYSHATGAGTDYGFQVSKNVEYVQEKSGLSMKHFSTPSGDVNYVPYAFSNGMKSIVSNNSSYFGFPNGFKVDGIINLNQFKLYRRFLYDGLYNPTNISQHVDNAAGLSVNGNHYWYSDFTHRVGFQQIGGSLVFPTLEYYMNYIANIYGVNGSDRVWAAGHQDVFEYLSVRENSTINWSLTGTQLVVVIDRINIPADLEKYALSLLVDADANIVSVSTNEVCGLSWNNQLRKLINLEWDQAVQKSAVVSPVIPDENNTFETKLELHPNPVIDQITLVPGNTKSMISVEVFNVFGKLVFSEKPSGLISTLNLNVSGLNPGLYFVRAKTTDGCDLIGKFIKE